MEGGRGGGGEGFGGRTRVRDYIGGTGCSDYR